MLPLKDTDPIELIETEVAFSVTQLKVEASPVKLMIVGGAA